MKNKIKDIRLYWHKLLCLFFLICISTNTDAVNYEKLLEKHNYEKAEKEMDEQKDNLTTEDEFFYYNFWRAVLLCKPDYQKFDPLKAYNIFTNLQKRFIALTDMQVVKKIDLERGIDNSRLTAYTDTACKYGLQVAEKANTFEAYNYYMIKYELSHPEYRDTARDRRDRLAYEITCKKNTENAYKRFVKAYPYAAQVPDAMRKIESINFQKAKTTNTARAYALFAARYPESLEIKEAKDSLYKLAFEDVRRVNLATTYEQYLEDYPESPYKAQVDSLMQDKSYTDFITPTSWSSYVTFLTIFPDNKKYSQRAMDSLLVLSLRQKSAKGLLFYLDHNPDCKNRDALVTKLYSYMSRDGEISTLNFFKEKFPKQALSAEFQKDYKEAQVAEGLDLRTPKLTIEYTKRLENYIKMAGDKELAFVALQMLIRQDLKDKNWKAAINEINKMKPYTKNNPSVNKLLEILSRKTNPGIKVEQISATQTEKGNEYYPIISADGKKLYFCGRDRNDNLGGEDVFVSEYTDKGWSKPTIFAPLSDKGSNDGMMAVSADGTQIIKFENGVMGVCTKGKDGWLPVEFFPKNINRGSWNCDATFCTDGSTLLFTSIRQSSSDINQTSFYHGSNKYESDLYVSHRDSNGYWSEPINLGPKINTMYSERTPFMHPDMKTLYFSSDGHGGLGGYDVYKATRLSDTCWTCWSDPVNLGKEINTVDDDWTYKISTDGNTAYFSQKDLGSNDSKIYSINLPEEQKPFKVVTISGNMISRSGKKVETEVVWEDLETKQIIGRAKTDPQSSDFFIVLPTGKLYGIYVNDSTIYPETRHIDLRNHNKAEKLEKTFHVTTIEEIKKGYPITINNIFFDFNKSELLSYSYPELGRLAKLLKKLNMKVEISGHTDNIGKDEVNLKLSKDRAESVKQFLVQHGCKDENIITQGYGKEKPIADNNTEAGRAKNRRVEMKVLK